MSERIENSSGDKPGAGSGRLDPVLLIVFLVCALALGGLVMWRANTSRAISAQDFKFAPLKVDEQKLRLEREERYASVRLDKVEENWAKLIEAARQANEAQFGEPKTKEEVELLTNALRFWASEVIPATGYDGFVAAGQPLRDACEEALAEVLKALKSGELQPEALKEQLSEEKYAKYRQNCGDMMDYLLKRGLVDPSGQWAFKSAPFFADLSARFLWAQIIEDQRSPWAQLTPYEAELFARWRVEQAEGFSLRRRRAYLEQFAQFNPGAELDYARGVLAFMDEDIEAALESFEKLAAEDPQGGFKSYVDFLVDYQSASTPARAEAERDSAL